MTVPRFRLDRLCLLAPLVFAFAIAAAPPPAQAQSDRELRNLTQMVERLQRELSDLQRQVYRGEAPERPPERIEAEVEPMADPRETPITQAAAARLQSRLDSIEQQIQNLTGQIEETRHQLRQVDDRVERLVADVDFRLRELEEAGTGAGAVADAPEGADVEEPALGLAEAGRGADGDAVADGEAPQTLGQVSQDAVDSLRREREERAAAGEAQTAAAPADGYELPDGDPNEQYQHAFNLLRQADYAEAEQALRAFVDAHPEHDLAGNATYWLGETHYVRGQYDQAAVTFAEGFQSYPDGGKAPDNLLKLGMSLAQIDRMDDACGIYAELLDRYPEAPGNILQRARREQAGLGC